jgi:hypothetical protein
MPSSTSFLIAKNQKSLDLDFEGYASIYQLIRKPGNKSPFDFWWNVHSPACQQTPQEIVPFYSHIQPSLVSAWSILHSPGASTGPRSPALPGMFKYNPEHSGFWVSLLGRDNGLH